MMSVSVLEYCQLCAAEEKAAADAAVTAEGRRAHLKIAAFYERKVDAVRSALLRRKAR